jgi:pyridoxamine 5'-phosphate oxidase
MEINDAIQFANENPICALATIDGNQPRVRFVGFWKADETGFYFQTGEIKAMVKQIRTNPNVEACFYKRGENAGQTLRVSGKIEFVDDMAIKKQCVAERPFLKSLGIEYSSPGFIIFRIAEGNLDYWDWSMNLKPKNYVPFNLK